MRTSVMEMPTITAFHFKCDPAIELCNSTFEAWVRIGRSARVMWFVFESGARDARRRTALSLTRGALSLIRADDGSPSRQATLTENLNIWDRQWHHLAVSVHGRSARIYVDGRFIAESHSDLLEPQAIEECGPLLWGAPSGESVFMHGARAWNRTLSETEIRRSMHDQTNLSRDRLSLDCVVRNGSVANRITGETAAPIWPIASLHHPAVLRADDDNSYVINDVDLVLSQDMVPESQDVTIYADTLTLPSQLKHQGNLSIVARSIIANGATIDLSGAPGNAYPADSVADKGLDGATPGAKGGKGVTGAAGGRGQDGGHLTIMAAGLVGTLNFVSPGGAGGRGQGGGPGGSGAQGSMGADCTQGGDYCSGWEDNPEPGGKGGDGGDGGDAGASGDGGNGGGSLLKLIEGQPSMPVQYGGPGPDQGASPGSPGPVGGGGLGGRHMDSHSSDDLGVSECYLGDDRADTGPPGDTGGYGGGPTGGAGGYPGTNVWQSEVASGFQAVYPISLALGTLQKAERAYFNGDYDTATTLLSWLSQVCSQDGEWGSIGGRVGTLLTQLSQGLTFYGRPRNAVPLADAPTYLTALGSLLTAGEIVEQDYFRFADQQQSDTARLEAIKSRLDGVQSAIQQLQDQMQKAADQQGPVNQAIDDLHAQIETQFNALVAAQTAFQDALVAKVGCANFMAILQAVGAVITTGAGGLQDLQKMGSALDSVGADLSGANTIIKGIKTATSDIQSVKNAWSQLAGLIANAPDAGKIAVQRSDFDQMMQPYLAMPEAQVYVTAMHAYLASVQARNQKILESDSLVILQAQIEATIAQKQAESARVSTMLADQANQDPTLPDYVAFMAGAYEDMQKLLLRYLFEANAALSYYTLVEPQLSVGSSEHALTMADIASAFSDIQTALPDFINNSNGPQQPFESLDVTLQPAATGVYSDAKDDPFQTFIAGNNGVHELPFSVPLNVLPGLYQVTASDFTITAPGFSTTNGQLMLRLRHSGYAPFLDATGATVEFSHDSIEVYYSYELDGSGNPKQLGGGSLSSTNYIGVSPCTSWLLTVRETENPGLDISRIATINLSFAGKSRLLAGTVPPNHKG